MDVISVNGGNKVVLFVQLSSSQSASNIEDELNRVLPEVQWTVVNARLDNVVRVIPGLGKPRVIGPNDDRSG